MSIYLKIKHMAVILTLFLLLGVNAHASLNVETPYTDLVISNATTLTYTYTFTALDDADVKASAVDAVTGLSVTLPAFTATTLYPSAGGTITFVSTPYAGDNINLHIYRDTPLEQTTDFTATTLRPQTIEDGLDKTVAMVQDTKASYSGFNTRLTTAEDSIAELFAGIAPGQGDMVGAESSTAGNLLSFADTSGRVAEDSGIPKSAFVAEVIAITTNTTISTHKFILEGGGYLISGGATLTFTVTPTAGDISIFSGAGSVILKRANPFWFGAVGDGTTNDTTAIQNAVNSVIANGGTVYFPIPYLYNIQSEITITSNYPINLISDMRPVTSNSYLKAAFYVGAAITGSVFNIDTRGGVIRGLYFIDPTGSIASDTQGTRAITSALELTRFSQGIIEKCSFDCLLGSAILSTLWIRGTLISPHIRNCGTPTQPAIYCKGTADNYGTIGLTLFSPHIEVCFGEYIHFDEYAGGNQVIAGHFEAYPDLATSCQYFIRNKGRSNYIIACGFARNYATQVYCDKNSSARIIGCRFDGKKDAGNYKLYIGAGSRNEVSDCEFRGESTDSGTSIYDYGGNTIFSNNRVYFAGNVILGENSVWTGGELYDLKTTKDYAIDASRAYSIVTGTVITGCDTAGGIKASNTVNVNGNTVYGNGGIGIYCTTANALINNNRCSTNTGGDFSFTAYPHALSPDSNFAGDGVYPLYYSVTWNPGSIAAGSFESISITGTSLDGAVVGDSISASFPMLVSSSAKSGMQISGTIVASRTALVTISNHNVDAVDLDSGTLVVKVTKK